MPELTLPPLSLAEQGALAALLRGQATSGQQIVAMTALFAKVCGLHESGHVPGDSHHTAFNEGRRWVALIAFAAAQIPVFSLPRYIEQEQ